MNLLNDLLDLSKLEAGKLELVYESTDIDKLIDDCIDEQAPAIRQKSIDIQRHGNGINSTIECDREKVFVVVRNLLSNAVKFCPEAGTIEFAYADGADGEEALELKITDDGEGINPDDVEKIFDKFAQSEKPHPGGTGLGLSICREIVLQHRGEIWAENHASRGATVSVRLPRDKPAESDAQ